MTLAKGQDVTVEFDGIEHLGRVEKIDHGWAICTIAIDPTADYGSGTERLAPHQTVAVQTTKVKPRESAQVELG